MVASPWRFDPPERQKGRVFYGFSNANDKDYSDVRPILAILPEKFGASLVTVLPSPYNTPYVLSVYGITVALVEDNWPTPYFSAAEDDVGVLKRLVDDLQRALGAITLDLDRNGNPP